MKVLLLIIPFLILASCNNAANEQAAIQAAKKSVIDSITMANKLQAEQKAFADSIKRITHAEDSLMQARQKSTYDSILESQKHQPAHK